MSAPDLPLLFAARAVRLFAYGFLSVVLVLYLTEVGLSEAQTGLLLALALAGDAVLSLWMTTRADRLGRRRMLLAGAALMFLAGVSFAGTTSFALLLVAATLGVISPSGNEVGPFLALEQASLAEQLKPERRTAVFAWYNLVGSLATALGSLASGGLVQLLSAQRFSAVAGYRVVVIGYGILGAALFGLFLRLTPAAEAAHRRTAQTRPAFLHAGLGLGPSRRNVLKLSGLFWVDALAGGFVVQTFVAYWFHHRFGLAPAALGTVFFGANLLAGLSALFAAALARRVGLLQTMVVTHLPSNLLLLLVPLMPTAGWAIGLLLLRFSISQMDVPTRQAYTLAMVTPEERSAAAGLTGIARTLGAALAPVVAGPLYASAALASVPFFVAGGLKVLYDLAVWQVFRKESLPDE